MLSDHFVTSDALGVRLFDKSGRFVQNLLMSDFKGQERNVQSITMDFSGYKKAIMCDISGTRCFLSYIDYNSDFNTFLSLGGLPPRSEMKGKFWAGEFNLTNLPLINPKPELASLSTNVEMVPVRSVPDGMFMDDNTQFKFRIESKKTIAVSFNSIGDTLCKFINHVAESSGGYPSDRSFFYRADGK
jgi:hypothetical protein